MNRTTLTPPCIVAIALLGAGLVVAGPLNPPGGPVAGTHKTLTEVEPRTAVNSTNTPGDADSLFKITQPGSYYLTSSITGVAGKHGVEITSSGVTLDLNGFDLVGIPGMGAFDGVSVTVDSLRGIAVLNGSVRDWGDGGVDLGFLSRGCRVDGVRASGNAGTGITSSISSTVTNCTASFNGQRGIFSSNGSTISDCSVESNSGNGIQVNNGCTVANSSAYFNTSNGILAGVGSTVNDCSALQNMADGIQIAEGGTISRCTVQSNAVTGIDAGDRCTISQCTATFNGSNGILANPASTILNCVASSNGGTGLTGLGHVLIISCTVRSNGNNGIFLGSGLVTGCLAVFNQSNGISATSGSFIHGNSCASNGQGGTGAGISASGAGVRIEGNKCMTSPVGINVSTSGNHITANSCSSNTTDWVIAEGNAIGPILDRRNPGGAAVNGFSASTTLNTTDPHANFSH